MTFGVGRTHDLLNTEEVAKDKKHLTLLLPRADVGNVSLSFFQRSTSCCRFFFFLPFKSFRSDQARVYLHTQVDYYILQQSRAS